LGCFAINLGHMTPFVVELLRWLPRGVGCIYGWKVTQQTPYWLSRIFLLFRRDNPKQMALLLSFRIVRVNLKSGSGKIVPQFRSNMPRLLKEFLKQVTGKIVSRLICNVAQWDAAKTETYFQCRFVPNFKCYFYYKYEPCIRWKSV